MQRLLALALGGLGRLDPVALLELVLLLVLGAPAHVASIRRARARARKGRPGSRTGRSPVVLPPACATGGETKRRASLPETVGAWLRVWTPPRDVEVPPVPGARAADRRRAWLLVLLAGAAALIVPAIDDSQGARARPPTRARPRSGARRARARDDRRAAPARARRRRAAARRRRAGARARRRPRRAAAAGRDARSATTRAPRADAGELRGPPAGDGVRALPEARPRRRPEQRPRAPRAGVYDCLVFVRAIAATETNVGGKLGYPFRAVLDFDALLGHLVQDQPGPGRARRARPAHGGRAARRPAAPAPAASRRTGRRGERPPPMGSPNRDRSTT